MIKILVADDHTLFREGLIKLMENDSELSVVGEAATGPETKDRTKELEPDVVLLDVSMPGRGGLETVQEIKARSPHIKVLMLTAHPEDHYAIRCLKGGADGYLTKDKAPEEVVEAIKRVWKGGKYVSSTLAEQLAMSLQNSFQQSPHDALSDREFQVMQLIAAGKTVSEIADELCLSVKTISTYRSRILRKLHLKNNAAIMHYAMREGLVDYGAGS